MTNDNLARTINRRLKDFYDIFGGQSREYRAVYNQVRNALDGAVFRPEGIIAGDIANAPLQISRSKQALKDLDNKTLTALNDRQKKQRSAKQLRSDRYIEWRNNVNNASIDDSDIDFNYDDFKDFLNQNFTFDQMRQDIYDAAKDNDDDDTLNFFAEINYLSPDDRRQAERDIVTKYKNILNNSISQDNTPIIDALLDGDLNDIGV